jgi:hypothetical protein
VARLCVDGDGKVDLHALWLLDNVLSIDQGFDALEMLTVHRSWAMAARRHSKDQAKAR